MKGESQFNVSTMSLLPQINSNIVKFLPCIFLLGLGVALCTMFSSDIKTFSYFSFQTAQYSPSSSPPLVDYNSVMPPSQNSPDLQKPEAIVTPVQPPKPQNLQINETETMQKPEAIVAPVRPPKPQNLQINETETMQKPEAIVAPVRPPKPQNLQINETKTMQKPDLLQPEKPKEVQKKEAELEKPKDVQIEIVEKPGNENYVHEMSDEILFPKALEISRLAEINTSKIETPKVAFMFLARGELPFMPFWERFFKGFDGKFSIYMHLSPDYPGNVPRGSVFYGRRIPSKIARWGDPDLVEAERRLLASALLDQSNQRFVLLSESCVPIFNFPTIYSYLINSQHSFLQVFDDPSSTGRGRYKKGMQSQIPRSQWRKGSQWFEIDRFLATEIISDQVYFPLFQRYCHGGCYTDEHYLPTLVYMKYGERNANRSVTWVDWSVKGPHPARYYRNLVTPEFLRRLREGYSCSYNGKTTNVCYLFARKFLPNSLVRFMRFAHNVLAID